MSNEELRRLLVMIRTTDCFYCMDGKDGPMPKCPECGTVPVGAVTEQATPTPEDSQP